MQCSIEKPTDSFRLLLISMTLKIGLFLKVKQLVANKKQNRRRMEVYKRGKNCVKCGGLHVITKTAKSWVSGNGSMKLFQFASRVAALDVLKHFALAELQSEDKNRSSESRVNGNKERESKTAIAFWFFGMMFTVIGSAFLFLIIRRDFLLMNSLLLFCVNLQLRNFKLHIGRASRLLMMIEFEKENFPLNTIC